jgi:microcystin-dependent protein
MALSSALGSAGAVPVGVVNPFAGATAPSGWMLCYGQAVSRTIYSALFACIGTTYGAGDASTTFNVPDMRGRVVAGEDDMGGTAASRLTNAGSGITGTTLGATGGAETVTLTSAQSGVPAHSHANTLVNNAVTTGAGSAHTHTQNAHDHYVRANSFAGDRTIAMGPVGADGDKYSVSDSGNDASTNSALLYADSRTATNQNESAHTHSVTSNVTISNVNNTAANAGSAHTNTQPTIVLNYIIKATN